MKATELRIGNYITFYSENDIEKVKELFSGFVNKIDIQDIKPIRLTEQWLIDFGFEKALNGWWDETENFSIENGVFRIGTDDIIKCEYVHQLQNLYFALTGKELTKRNNG